MKKIDLGQTVNTLANLGVLGGIVLLSFELRQNSEFIRIEAAQAHLNNSYEVGLLIATHGFDDSPVAELLLSSSENRSDVDRFRYQQFADSVLRSWQNSFHLDQQSVLPEGLWEAQTTNIINLLRSEGDLRVFWEENRARFTPDFNSHLDSLIEATPSQ